MEQFRNLTNNIFFKIFLSFVGLSFIFFGISDLVFEGNNSYVAKINGKKITQIQFSRELENQKANIYSRNPSPELLDYVNSDDFRNAVLGKSVSNEILKSLISEMDLDLNSDLAVRQILDQEEFKDDAGNFDKMRFQSYLRINNLNSEKYLDELNFRIASNIIFSALDIQNIQIDPDLLAKQYQFLNQERKISILSIKKENLKTTPKINDKDLRKYYRENKNKYKKDELRKISLITIDRKSLISDINISKDEILLEYNNNGIKYTIPEKRKLYNIFFTQIDEAEDFLSKIDNNKDIKQQFKDVAQKHFDKEEGEILLDVAKTQLPAKIADQVFSLTKNNISKILESDYGFHIVYLDNIIKSSKKSLKEVEKQIHQKLLKEKSSKIISQKISNIEDEIMLLDSIAEFSQKFPFAKIKKLPFINIDMISDKGQKIDNNDIENIIEDIFFLDSNQFSEINISKDEEKYHIAFIDKIIDERQKTFEEVKRQLNKELLNIKKNKALIQLSEDIAVEITNNPKNINKIIKKYGFKFIEERNVKRFNKIYPQNFTSAIFNLKQDQSSRSVKISDNIYYIAILNDISWPDKKSIDQEKLKEVESKYRNDIYSDIWGKLERYLEQKYQVEIR
ncbi:peptidyl-prolyl cis-trans isomerase [Rickettsiales bacterium]|nr:peptidyl-prolyl cis-trans isomerase [Rickettsiales bacterium]MDB2550661.1 peptidyl-prolyl cis-trans isomerase [Rickettsiales bacterium]